VKQKKDHPLRRKELVRRIKVKPPTQEEIDLAKEEYFKSGKKVEKLKSFDIKSKSLFFEADTEVEKSFDPEIAELQESLTIINHDKG